MSVSRVNPSNWATNAKLTRAQATQLDKNHTYIVDKSAGNTDTIHSGLTINPGGGGNGSLHVNSGANVNIQDPSVVSVADGYLTIDCQLYGDGYTNPLCFGYTSIALPASGIVTLDANTYLVARHIRLTGTISGPVIIILPNIIGYQKFIEGNYTPTTGDYVSLSLGSGAAVILEPQTSTLVYTRDTGIYEIASTNHLRLVDEIAVDLPLTQNYYYSRALIPDTSLTAFSGNNGFAATIANVAPNASIGDISIENLGFTNLTTPGKLVFLDVRAGDKFEIFFSCVVSNAAEVTPTYGWVAPYIVYGNSWSVGSSGYNAPTNPQYAILSEVMIPFEGATSFQGSGRTVFQAPQDGVYEFKTLMYYSQPDITSIFPIASWRPLTYIVSQYRGA